MLQPGVLEAAIAAFPLKDYVIEHGASEEGDGEWYMDCPMCFKHKLAVNIDRKTWHCWVCQQFEQVYVVGAGYRTKILQGAGGLVDLIILLDRATKQEAVQRILVANAIHPMDLIRMPDFTLEDLRNAQMQALPKGEVAPPEGMHFIAQEHPYITSRGISLEQTIHYRLGYCPSGRFAGRVVFPVYEANKLVYFQARATWAEQDRPHERYVKTLNPSNADGAQSAGEVLFNYDLAVQYPSVVLTEGPIDAVHAGYDAVCTFGKRLSPAQAGKLVRAGVRHIEIMWDNDAINDAYAAARQYSGLFESVRVVHLPYGDPGEFPTQQLLNFRRYSAVTIGGFSLGSIQ